MCSPKMHLSQNYIKTNTEENVPDFGFVDKNKTYENQFPFHFELAASKWMNEWRQRNDRANPETRFGRWRTNWVAKLLAFGFILF